MVDIVSHSIIQCLSLPDSTKLIFLLFLQNIFFRTVKSAISDIPWQVVFFFIIIFFTILIPCASSTCQLRMNTFCDVQIAFLGDSLELVGVSTSTCNSIKACIRKTYFHYWWPDADHVNKRHVSRM